MSLSKLIEAVADERATITSEMLGALPTHPEVPVRRLVLNIIHNGKDLTSALALHDALLPGWQWLVRSSDDQDVRSGRCQHGQFLANIWREGSPNEGAEHFPTWVDDPARAWLLAILRALEQEGGDG